MLQEGDQNDNDENEQEMAALHDWSEYTDQCFTISTKFTETNYSLIIVTWKVR